MLKPFIATLIAASMFAAPVAAQVTTVDPSAPVEESAQPEAATAAEWENSDVPDPAAQAETEPGPAPSAASEDANTRAVDAVTNRTIPQKDVFAAAEGVFGKGAVGLADMIADVLRKQGEPNAYITGSEASGAFIAGFRYGSGMLHHQVEGDRKVHWTGPSIGFDFGGDASKVFVLVYNLHDSERLFRRYPAAEGNAYVIGGFTASYMRRGDVVLIPVRMGVGARLGVNAGYMRFSQKTRWLPF
jgi:hypothetical protein